MADEYQVAILLPVQGTDAALDRTVASVLAQTETRWTLWLIESNDARGRAARWMGGDPRIQCVRQAGRGRAAVLRQALARCPGDYTVFLDAEHCWEPGFLALTTTFLQSNPLEDVVCMDVVESSGPSVVAARRSIFRERKALHDALDLPAGTVPDALLAGACWYRGELARHLRWGPYSQMAVTLMTAEAALRLAPALGRDSTALDYRLQARLARTCPVNLLALTGAVRWPTPWSAEQELQQERDALEVFDEIHGRQWETDPEVARLRRERLTRLQRSPLQRLLGHVREQGCQTARAVLRSSVLPGVPHARVSAPMDLGGPQVRHQR